MKYIDADRLRAEIEKVYKSEIQPWLSGVSPKSAIYEYVLPIIDSLQNEQPDVNLEKEIDACWQNWLSPSNQKEVEGVLPKTEFAMYARHFAEWQSKQDKETIELAEDHAYLAGAVNEREKMMKEAIHYVVQDDLDSHGASYNIPFIRLGTIALKPKGIGVGDKVRIIIVKED